MPHIAKPFDETELRRICERVFGNPGREHPVGDCDEPLSVADDPRLARNFSARLTRQGRARGDPDLSVCRPC
jgi:hypothetical protein